jgi:hypothetical protein
MAIRNFYSLLRVAIKSARRGGHLKLLNNDQTIPGFMGMMPYADWKQWATSCPEWMREETEDTLKRFVELKWNNALDVTAAESTG